MKAWTWALGIFLATAIAHAEPMNSRIGHLYWGLGANFGLLGNVRLGRGPVEFGIVQGAFGIMGVHRTSSPLFLQLGVFGANGGTGIMGGGGMEWNTSSWFRFRGDVTVGFDQAYQTQSTVSLGGVLIL